MAQKGGDEENNTKEDLVGDTEDTLESDEEEKGFDQGFNCKLDPEERDKPEYQALIAEGQ